MLQTHALLIIAVTFFVLGCSTDNGTNNFEQTCTDGYNSVELCEEHNAALQRAMDIIEANGNPCGVMLASAMCNEMPGYCNDNCVSADVAEVCFDEAESFTCDSMLPDGTFDFYGDGFPNCQEAYRNILECF